MSNVNFNFHPFDEKNLKDAVKRLAFFFASDMGWTPKSISNNGNSVNEETTGEIKDNE